MAPENAVPVVELPLSEEYGDSEEIDLATAASTAARIAKFILASEGALGAGTSKGGADIWLPRRSVREGTWAAVKPGIPRAFDRNEQTEFKAWEGFDRASGDIERALWFALDVLQGQHLQTENVSNCPAIFITLRFMISCSHLSFCSS